MASRLFSCFLPNRTTSLPSDDHSTTHLSPVLLELFSSQGCATSPDAEAMAASLAHGDILPSSDDEALQVAVLVFHVDYWDYRGWKDPFASTLWTVRQKAYVESLRVDTLFTPQVVVHGRLQCVGNDQEGVLSGVRSAPRFPSPNFKATFKKPSPDTLQVSFTGQLGSKIDGRADVMVALYENGLVTSCTAGENKGRVLANDYVVRRFQKLVAVKDISAKKNLSASVQFPLWEDFNSSKCGVVLFVQNASLQTFGVQQFKIPETI